MAVGATLPCIIGPSKGTSRIWFNVDTSKSSSSNRMKIQRPEIPQPSLSTKVLTHQYNPGQKDPQEIMKLFSLEMILREKLSNIQGKDYASSLIFDVMYLLKVW